MMKPLLISSAAICSFIFSLPANADITAATTKTKEQINTCVTKNLDELSDIVYIVLEQVKPTDTAYTVTEYKVAIKGKAETYRFNLNSWDSRRILSLHSTGNTKTKDQRLESIALQCGSIN